MLQKNRFAICDERKYIELQREAERPFIIFYVLFLYLLQSTEIFVKYIYKQNNALLCIPEVKEMLYNDMFSLHLNKSEAWGFPGKRIGQTHRDCFKFFKVFFM